MQGIVILGGNGTRLNLFSKRVNNKALAIVYDRLVFEYPLNTLVRAGITDITLVVGSRYAGDIVNVIGDGREFGVEKIHYVYQKDALGISHAVYQAKNIIKDKCAVILGDNFYEMDILEQVKDFERRPNGCGVFLKEVPDPERYGVAEINGSEIKINNKAFTYSIENIEEKPKEPKTNLAVTGLYFYDNSLFNKIEQLKPSVRGELEVTDLNMLYVKEKNCVAYRVNGYWNDMGTFDSLLECSNFVKTSKFGLSYNINAWSK